MHCGDGKCTVRSVNVSDIGIYIFEVNSLNGNPIFENGDDLFYSQSINVLPEAQKINLANVNDGIYELTLTVKINSTMEITRVTERVTVSNGNDCNVTFREKTFRCGFP